MLSHKASHNVLGNSQQQTSSSSIMQKVLHLNNGSAQKAAISIKLTDDCLQNLQIAARSGYPVLVHVNKTEIVIEIKESPSSSLKFYCFLQKEPGISFLALQKTDNAFSNIAHIPMRAQVKPTQQTLIMGCKKIQQGSKLRERESKKCRTQMLPGPLKPGDRSILNNIKQIESRVAIGNNTNNASMRNGSNAAPLLPVSLVPSKSLVAGSESPHSLRDCSLRIRVIHYIAASRFRTPDEIVEQIMSEGLPRNVPIESVRRKIREIICEVAVEYNDPPRIALDPKYFREVDINWSFFDSTDRENVKHVLSKTEVAVGSNFAPTRASRRAPMIAPRKRENVTPTMSNSTTTSPDLASDGSNCSTPSPSGPSLISVDSGYSPSLFEKRKLSLIELSRIPEDDVFALPPAKKRLVNSESTNKVPPYLSSAHKAETAPSQLVNDPKAKSKSAFVGNGSTASFAEKNGQVVAAMNTLTDIGASLSSSNSNETDRYLVACDDSQKAVNINNQSDDLMKLMQPSSNAANVDDKTKNYLSTPSRSHQHHSDKDRIKDDRTKKKKDREQRKANRQFKKAEKERLNSKQNQSNPDKESANLEKEQRRAEKKMLKEKAKAMLHQEKFTDLAEQSLQLSKLKEERKRAKKAERARKLETSNSNGKPADSESTVKLPKAERKYLKEERKIYVSSQLRTPAVSTDINVKDNSTKDDLSVGKNLTNAGSTDKTSKDLAVVDKSIKDMKPVKLHRTEKKGKKNSSTEKFSNDLKPSGLLDEVPKLSMKSDKAKHKKERKAEKRSKSYPDSDNLVKALKIDSSKLKFVGKTPDNAERNTVCSRPTSTLDNFSSLSTSSQRTPMQSDSSAISKLLKSAEMFDNSGTTTQPQRCERERSERKKEKHRLAELAQMNSVSSSSLTMVDKNKSKERSKSERRLKEGSHVPMSRSSMAVFNASDSCRSFKSNSSVTIDKSSFDVNLTSTKSSQSRNDRSEKMLKFEQKSEKNYVTGVFKRPTNEAEPPIKPTSSTTDVVNKKRVVDSIKSTLTTPSLARTSKESDNPKKSSVVPNSSAPVAKKSEPLTIQSIAKLSKPIVRDTRQAPSKPTTPLLEDPLDVKNIPLDKLLKLMSDTVKPTKRYEDKYPVLRTPAEAKIYSDHEIEYYKLYEKSYNSLVSVQHDLSVYVERMNKTENAEDLEILKEKIRKYAANCLSDETFNNQRKTVANMTDAIRVLRNRLDEYYGSNQS